MNGATIRPYMARHYDMGDGYTYVFVWARDEEHALEVIVDTLKHEQPTLNFVGYVEEVYDDLKYVVDYFSDDLKEDYEENKISWKLRYEFFIDRFEIGENQVL
jgi:hypothetical protein